MMNIFKSKKRILCLAAVCVLAAGCLTGCGKTEAPEEPKEEAKPVYTSPLTGETREKEYPARPLVVSIDNVGDAIPQSWLSKTDLVYEFPVEGQQSRLNAIYHSEFPERFGPIRSTRPYFVDLTREYKGIFLAHGWSPAARRYLETGVVPYINAMVSSLNFYRIADKENPHDSYISWSEVKGAIKEEGWWKEKQDIESFAFLEEGQAAEGADATFVRVDYGANQCEYTYDAEQDLYVRTIDGGEPYVDFETGEPITVKNILVQRVQSEVLDSKGRLEIDMCAGGKAMLFTGGKVVKGTWSRADLDSRTIFVDEEGNSFKLSVGNSWVQVADQDTLVRYKAPKAEESADAKAKTEE